MPPLWCGTSHPGDAGRRYQRCASVQQAIELLRTFLPCSTPSDNADGFMKHTVARDQLGVDRKQGIPHGHCRSMPRITVIHTKATTTLVSRATVIMVKGFRICDSIAPPVRPDQLHQSDSLLARDARRPWGEVMVPPPRSLDAMGRVRALAVARTAHNPTPAAAVARGVGPEYLRAPLWLPGLTLHAWLIPFLDLWITVALVS